MDTGRQYNEGAQVADLDRATTNGAVRLYCTSKYTSWLPHGSNEARGLVLFVT
jgi:hypothetical protein